MAADPKVEEVELSSGLPESVQQALIEAERGHSRRGLIGGLFVIVLGVVLILLGATGSIDLRLEGMGLSVQAAKATPGITLILVGLFIVWATRMKIKVKTR